MAQTVPQKELHRIVPTAIIYKPNFTYLVTRRKLDARVHPGKWCVPGGGLSIDDYINEPITHGTNGWYGIVEKTLKREVREEVGLEIDKPEYLLDLTFMRPDGVPVLVLSYFAKYISGDVILDEDTTDFAWVTTEEAQNYDLIPGTLEEIQEVDKILRERNDRRTAH